ncbi:ceramide-1-phosphate transfer protein-like isoform X2 [Homarus americanus]|uniref:ceramide-1-phosphate transfer protein-like isoform X2 n=1 Tax=Homarus americanus TaxID=6706 RepID=UPI001C478B37|nr:ceramide-1-phosphate transfer protein-like isoform X2 [Homarus americanus]
MKALQPVKIIIDCAFISTGSNRMEEQTEGDNNEMVMRVTFITKGFRLKEDGLVDLQDYVNSYIEMNKFFKVLGPFFQFIARDVGVKLAILQKYLDGSNRHHYSTVQSMIKYEKEKNLLTSSDRSSGARTLLRVHRALDFVKDFIVEILNSSDSETFGKKVSSVYTKTLAKFHGPILANTLPKILLLMPSHQVILDRLSRGNTATETQLRAELLELVTAVNVVYNKTQQIYEENEIFDLP